MSADVWAEFPGELARRIHEHGDQAITEAKNAAYEWTSWAKRLDALLRQLPLLPTITYIDETGDEHLIRRYAGADIHAVLTEILTDALARADHIAQEYRRLTSIAGGATNAALATFGATYAGNGTGPS